MNGLFVLLRVVSAFADEGIVDAAESGHEHVVSVPWGQVGTQAFNLFALVALLVYLLQKSVKAHFAHRATEYKELVARAENARLEAERNKRDIEARLQTLQSGAAKQLEQARTEGKTLHDRLMTEAQTLGAKVEQEALRTLGVELDKAKSELRLEVLHQALKASGENLGKNLSVTEQKKLQNEFAEKIQVVGG